MTPDPTNPAGAELPENSAADVPFTGQRNSHPELSMIRSHERLQVTTVPTARERVRLEKFIVTEERTITVTLRHEEVRLIREPISDEHQVGADQPKRSEEARIMILSEERPLVTTEIIPIERVWLDIQTITENQVITDTVREEKIDLDGPVT